MRLNRFLSVSGFSSRRKGETIIRSGRVRINGEVVDDPARDVDPVLDRVTVDDRELTVHEKKRWYVMNKPAGVIVSRGDTHGRATVYDLLDSATTGVFSVGRLDFNTSGVLLFTDDGDAAHRLMHPSFRVDKVYRAEVRGRVSGIDCETFRRGIVLDDGPTAPAEMRILSGGSNSSIVEIVIHEGRKRQVRRMLDSIGHPVMTLERVSFGGVTAAGLSPGGVRALDPGEVARLNAVISHETPGHRNEKE